jgi:hypothetical protein
MLHASEDIYDIRTLTIASVDEYKMTKEVRSDLCGWRKSQRRKVSLLFSLLHWSFGGRREQ